MSIKQMKVAANLQQDFTAAEKAQARKNIDADGVNGYVTCYLPYSDSSWQDVWYKLCELDVGTSDSYSYNYELAMKLICTNNGGGDCPAESASVDIGCNFIPRLNVGRCECTFADHTVSDHEQQTILGIKILTHRASDNYGPRDKAEVWVKCSKYFTSETQMRVECLMNAGTRYYRSNYSTPTLYDLPWIFRNTTITGTHTDPFNDSNHPAAEGYGAAGWSEVWYDAEPKTVMVDHEQNFTDAEKEMARDNIGAADGKISWVEYHESAPQPIVTKSGLSVVNSDRGARIQNDDASIQYFVAPPPVTGDTGKVLGVTQVGSVGWVVPPIPSVSGDEIEMEIQYDMNNSSATALIDSAWLDPVSACTEFYGTVGFTTTSSGTFALVPLDSDSNLVKGSQCVNLPGVPTGQVNHFNFMFKADYPGQIRRIGIKGLSENSQATFTQVFVVRKK
jgi:hypothetical protein